MATVTYPLGILYDDSGAILTAPVVTIASVTDKAGTAIASPGATVNGSGTATPISVDYDAESHGESWITLAVSQSGRTVTGANASIAIYAAKDSSRIVTALPATGTLAVTPTLATTQTFNNTGAWTGNLSGSVGSVATAVTVGTNNDKTGYSANATNLPSDYQQRGLPVTLPTTAPTGYGGSGGTGLDAAGTRAALGMASANLDTQIGAVPASTVTTLKADTDWKLIVGNVNGVFDYNETTNILTLKDKTGVTTLATLTMTLGTAAITHRASA
jgi:hypothetical protein